MLKERLISTLQRDRLSDFLKEAYQQKSGCFYYSLLMCWEKIYSDKLLDKNVAEKILNLSTSLSVDDTEVIDRIKDLEEILHLKVVKVTIPSWIKQDTAKIRKVFKIPNEIPVEKEAHTKKIRPMNKQSSAAIFWKHDDGSHSTSLYRSTRFDGIEKERGNIGGQEGYDLMMKLDAYPRVFFHISSTEK